MKGNQKTEEKGKKRKKRKERKKKGKKMDFGMICCKTDDNGLYIRLGNLEMWIERLDLVFRKRPNGSNAGERWFIKFIGHKPYFLCSEQKDQGPTLCFFPLSFSDPVIKEPEKNGTGGEKGDSQEKQQEEGEKSKEKENGKDKKEKENENEKEEKDEKEKMFGMLLTSQCFKALNLVWSLSTFVTTSKDPKTMLDKIDTVKMEGKINFEVDRGRTIEAPFIIWFDPDLTNLISQRVDETWVSLEKFLAENMVFVESHESHKLYESHESYKAHKTHKAHEKNYWSCPANHGNHGVRNDYLEPDKKSYRETKNMAPHHFLDRTQQPLFRDCAQKEKGNNNMEKYSRWDPTGIATGVSSTNDSRSYSGQMSLGKDYEYDDGTESTSTEILTDQEDC